VLPDGATGYANAPIQRTVETREAIAPYNPDPVGTLMTVLEQEGKGIALVGGSVIGGIMLLLVAARHFTRIPKDQLATGLGRTLTLLENNHRAGTLTPPRALEVARQVISEMEQEHVGVIRTRTQEYAQAVVRLTKSHTDAVAAIREEATHAVKHAQAETSQANTHAESALQRAANAEVQVQQLSRDLATTHRQLMEANALIRNQTTEITELNQGLSEATDTLVQWQEAHKDVSDRYVALTVQHQQVQQALTTVQTTVTEATKQCQVVKAEAQSLRIQHEAWTQEKTAFTEQLSKADREISRLRGVNLRELPFTIAEREDDLVPYMAEIVGFIRGMSVDSGAANGERTTKPILTSWREIRRLLQTLKTKGLRFAVTTHHVPQWARELVEGESKGEEEIKSGKSSSNVQALTKTGESAHNGASSTDLNTSEADVSLIQHT